MRRFFESFSSEKQETNERPPYERKDDEESLERISQIDKDDIISELKNMTLRSELAGQRPTIEALSRLSIELEDDVLTYDTILSDDTSGRLVSLFLRKLINNARERSADEEEKTENERPPIKTYFLAAGRHNDEGVRESIKSFVEKKKEELGKVLLVTEYMESGNSIKKLADVLEDVGVDFDIATVSKIHKHYGKSIEKRLRYGSVGPEGLSFFNSKRSTGVEKMYGEEAIKSDPHPQKRDGSQQQKINTAREDMSMLADKISEIIEVRN